MSAYLNGHYNDEHERRSEVARLNREIVIKARYPIYMPERDLDV